MATKFFKSFAFVVLKFILIFGAGFFLVEWLAQNGALAHYGESIAFQTSALSTLFHIPHTLDGLNIVTQTRTLVIVAECTAIFLMIAYAALILAYPFSIEIKALALLGGLIFIYLLNLARLVLTVAIADRVSNATFNYMHTIFFQGFMVLVLLVMWAMLLSFDKNGKIPREALIFFGLVVVALFAFEGVTVWLDELNHQLFPLSEMVYLPPALAVIVCTRGRSWKYRAILFTITSLVFLGGIQLQAFLASQVQKGVFAQTTVTLWATEILYGLCIVGIPIMSIVAVAGSKPSRLWQKA